MSSISLQNISFTYGEHYILRNYSVSFNADELSVIMSPSGSGKTTLLYLIAGLLDVDAGHISYPNDNPTFSMVFQDCRLIDNITVESNLRLVNSSLSDNEISECLINLGLDNFTHKKVKHLSGGEKQRVAIARAILADYDILLMDEPFTGLDDDTKENVIAYIKKKTAHKTVLVVTHDKTEAASLGNNIITLAD